MKKSKKLNFLLMVMLLALVLTACSSSNVEVNSKTGAVDDAAISDDTMIGTITDATSMNVIAIEARDGVTYIFSKDDNTEISPDVDMAIGQIIEVTYSGDIGNNPVAVKVVPGEILERE